MADALQNGSREPLSNTRQVLTICKTSVPFDSGRRHMIVTSLIFGLSVAFGCGNGHAELAPAGNPAAHVPVEGQEYVEDGAPAGAVIVRISEPCRMSAYGGNSSVFRPFDSPSTGASEVFFTIDDWECRVHGNFYYEHGTLERTEYRIVCKDLVRGRSAFWATNSGLDDVTLTHEDLEVYCLCGDHWRLEVSH